MWIYRDSVEYKHYYGLPGKKIENFIFTVFLHVLLFVVTLKLLQSPFFVVEKARIRCMLSHMSHFFQNDSRAQCTTFLQELCIVK